MAIRVLKQTETSAVIRIDGTGGTLNLATDLLTPTAVVQGTPTVNIVFASWNISGGASDKIAINRGSGNAEVATLTGVSGLTAGQTYIIAGLTYTSTAITTQAQMLSAFANLASGATTGAGTATGTYSGALTEYSTGPVVSNVVTFTSTANPFANVTDLTDSGTGAAAGAVSVITQGVAPGSISILNLQANGNTLDLGGNGGFAETTESTTNFSATITGTGEAYLTLRKTGGYVSKINPETFGSYDNPALPSA